LISKTKGPHARCPGVDAIVAAVSASGPSPAAYRAAYLDTTETLLELARIAEAPRFVYLGSTRIFGQDDGSVVDERTATQPTDANARILVEAERRVLTAGAEVGGSTSVVRLSGLYGPGRHGVVDRVRTGRLALGMDDGPWMNWCHLTDAVRTVAAALTCNAPRAVYHASDTTPTRRGEVIRWIAERLGIDPPRQAESFDAGQEATGTGTRGRRISAEKSRTSLGIELAYPSFRDGLASSFDRAD